MSCTQGATGEKGDTGERGPIGATGSAGPRGERGLTGLTGLQGPAGDDGLGINWTDAWADATAYEVNDAVSQDGSSYIAMVAHTSSTLNQPAAEDGTWGLLAASGEVSGGAITSLNSLTTSTQTFATGTSGTDFAVVSAVATHTFNLPTASATNRGALSTADWTTFNNKMTSLNALTATAQLLAVDTTGPIGWTSTTATHTLNLPSATAAVRGVLTAADWTTFNAKVSTTRSIATTTPLAGGGDLSADRTLTVGGLSTIGTANYIVGVNAGASAWEYKQLVQGGNVTISHGVGSVTITATDSAFAVASSVLGLV